MKSDDGSKIQELVKWVVLQCSAWVLPDRCVGKTLKGGKEIYLDL